MKTITIILFTLILNTCGNTKATTNETAEEPNPTSEEQMEISKTVQDNITIEYRAHTRGSFKKIVINNKKITVQNVIDGKEEVKTCSDEDWNALMALIQDTDLKAMTTLEAPTKAHQYDGAPMVNFSITIDGDAYDAPVFDGGNPNKAIEPLVTMVLNIASETKG